MLELLPAMLLPVLLCCTATANANPIPADCKEQWYTQRLDHFHWVHGKQQPTFQQRYFICDAHWITTGQQGPIFFYAGNEAPLEGYLRSAGLMFEHAPQFGALVVFAEHRYYGKTQPCGPDSWRKDPSYLTSEQAMADYTTLLWHLTHTWQATDSPIIAYGGSYGGMLAAWMRRQYPHIIAGAVAASAPVGQFPGVQGFDPSAFWEVVTRDATPAAGVAEGCDGLVRQAFAQLLDAGRTDAGRQQLQQSFRLCDPLKSESQVKTLAYWVQGAFDAYAMGNYPFPSDYMGGTAEHPLPAWPMRAACKAITAAAPSATASAASQTDPAASSGGATASVKARLGRLPSYDGVSKRRLLRLAAGQSTAAGANDSAGSADLFADDKVLVGLREAAGLLYNATGDVLCFQLDLRGPAAGNSGPWDYQVCTEFLGQELPYFPASGKSMFWDQGPFDWESVVQHCQQTWGVAPSKHWAVMAHGGLDWRGTSNIVFSNGLLDPWSAFGVLANVSDSVVAVIIPDGAHHLDLMYSRPDDSETLKTARVTIMQHVSRWVQQHQTAKQL